MARGIILAAFCLIMMATLSEAGFRCSFGNWACSFSCKMYGQKSGLCDDIGKCWCSEELDTLDNFKDLLNRACDFGVPHCQRTCHSLGRQDGNCSATGCTCANERLSSTDFALCAAESTCRLHCQSEGRGSGICEGWNCVCQSRV